MADDFRIKIDSDLDLTKAESKINSFLNKYNGKEKIKLDVELNNDLLNSLTKQFSNIGATASSAFNKGFNLSKSPTVKEFVNFKKTTLKQAASTKKEINAILGNSIDDKTKSKWANEYISNQRKETQKAIKELKNTEKQFEKIQREINSGSFELRSKQNQAFLDKYAGQDSASLTKLKNQIEEVDALQNKLATGGLGKSDVISTYEKLNVEVEKLKNNMKEVSIETSKTLGVGVGERSSNKVTSYINENTKALKKYEVELRDLEQRYKSITTQAEKIDLDRQFNNLKSKISAEGLTGKSFFEEVGRGFKQIGQFVGAYGILENVAQEIPSQIIQAVRDINESQIELTKVSSAPTSDLSSYWDRAADSAKKYGATISDVINSTADWSRLGYSLEDAEKLSNATTLLKNVGDNMTQESSSSGLISTLKGFKLAADEAESIVDKVNEVANTQPIDTAGLFAGLERSASSMSAANNSLEETIALITAANSVVQDPAKIGNGLKTISMRLRGASTELQEAGLDTEGMASSTAKLREELISLSGVDIMIDDNTFKSTYQILDELSEKWTNLSDIQQASITELIAGKHQGNTMSSLMQQFSIARETLDTAMNKSAGSASKELENWNRGIEASIEHFKAQFQELASVTLSSDFFKGFVDGGTNVLSILTQIIDKVGILTPLIAGFATKQGLGKRNATLYKVKQNYRRFTNVESFVTSNTNKPYRIYY